MAMEDTITNMPLKVSLLPTPSCLKYFETVFWAHEKKSEVQQGEYFPNNSRIPSTNPILPKVFSDGIFGT
jgi:ubiquitin C-terminal hydrolase